jgi:autotransporter strand-loop-strand O-heptosyltransferase
MKEVLIQEYNNLEQLNLPYKQNENKFFITFVGGAKCEIIGDNQTSYIVKFIDTKFDKVLHESEITNNMWTQTTFQYFVNWKIEVTNKETDEIVFEHYYNAKGKRVYIHLDSSAIGDTLAWFPYIEEFRKKHQCQVVCSTFHNKWFKDEYPELEFVEPSTEVFDLYAMYTIGWYYDEDRNVVNTKIPIEFKQHPLGQTSTSILGLDYFELRPKLALPKKSKQIEGKYVVIAPHASAHAKYWNHPGGWQVVIDYLNDKGYKVVMITSEKLGDAWHDSKLGGTLTGVVNKTGNYPIEDRMIDMKYADAFIGVGSGLSWLAWSIGTPVVMISGFSEPYTEFLDCERVFNYDPNVCTGCFNKHWLNPGDWEWCPEHKDTPRHFECTKTIKPEQVIVSIDKILNIYQ